MKIVALFVLVYLTLDLTNPFLPGVFTFEHSIDASRSESPSDGAVFTGADAAPVPPRVANADVVVTPTRYASSVTRQRSWRPLHRHGPAPRDAGGHAEDH